MRELSFGGWGSPFFFGQNITTENTSQVPTKNHPKNSVMLLTWCWWRHLHPPWRSSKSRVSSVSTSAQIWGFFCCHGPMLKGIDIYSLKALLHLLAHHVFSLAIIIPLAYKRLRKWWNETIVPQFFSTAVFKRLQLSSSFFWSRRRRVFYNIFVLFIEAFSRIPFNVYLPGDYIIYVPYILQTWQRSERMALNQLLDWPFLKVTIRILIYIPTFKKKLTLKPKKKVMSSHEEWSPLRESLCLGGSMS